MLELSVKTLGGKECLLKDRCVLKLLPGLQNGLEEAKAKSRKQIKERKNRSKKVRGVKKNTGELHARFHC